MNKISRRSFVALAGLSLFSLVGCGSQGGSDSKAGTSGSSSGSKSNLPEPNGKPFQLINYTYSYNDTKSHIDLSYAVRNNLTDKAIVGCPFIATTFDAEGKQMEFGRIPASTTAINPGEISYDTLTINLSESEIGKVNKVTFDVADEPIYGHDKVDYYVREPLPEKLFEVTQDGEVMKDEFRLQVRCKVTPTEALQTFAKSNTIDSITCYGIFFNDKDEMVAVASNAHNIYDSIEPYDELLTCSYFPIPEYSRIEFRAVPDIDIAAMVLEEFK